MKYVQILASTLAFIASAALLAQMRTQDRLWAFVVLFLLCGTMLLSRFTEMSVNDQIADAEEKVAKRVLRRLAKVMPGLLDEYFKATATKHAEKLSDVIVATREIIRETEREALVDKTTKAVELECQKLLNGGIKVDPITGHVLPIKCP